MNIKELIINKLEVWQPPPPEVVSRSNRDVTLTFSAGPFSFLGDQLMYKVEKKEKIPPWTVVYSGGKTMKTLENLAPSHPHRFRMKVIIKSTSHLASLRDDDARAICEELSAIDESEDWKQSKESNSSEDNKASSVSYTMSCGKTLLSYQTVEGLEKRCKWAESRWSDEIWTSTDSDGTSAICFCMAVRCGYLKQVQQMLDERPSLISVVNATNGFTPLATAVKKGDLNMVRFLLTSNAELDQCSTAGQTPLHLAILAGHISIAELLLEKGADFQARDFNKLRVEHYAVDSCSLGAVKFVLAAGGDVGARDGNGWTPLFRAVCQGAKTEIIEELVRRGSDVEIVDNRQLSLAAAARLLKDRRGRRRESVLRLVDSQFQHEKVVANFTRLTKKISSVHTLLSVK
ncbi:unnamed protein product, partial [Brenthis ino]